MAGRSGPKVTLQVYPSPASTTHVSNYPDTYVRQFSLTCSYNVATLLSTTWGLLELSGVEHGLGGKLYQKETIRMQPLFVWDEANLSHIAEHGVSPAEAEQVVLNEPIDLELQTRGGEKRTLQVGETDAGRILVVVTTWRDGKVRVVTAFPAKKKIREFYEKQEGVNYGGGVEDP
jgi:uncharacterized DUF497 family protein